MKKIIYFFIIMMFFTVLFSKDQKKKYSITKAYSYKEASLLISETDLNCTFFIREKIKKDIVIIGAKQMDFSREGYSDGDKLFINKGSADGLHKGDIFMVLEKGHSISNPFKILKSLGTYYLKKSLAEVFYTYPDKSIITLINGCNAVNIGDMLIPYKKEEIEFKKKAEYKKCILPKSKVKGKVVYIDLYTNFQKEIASTSSYIAVDLGKAMVKKGDFLLFYKMLNKKLPPVIIGTGIVINAQNTNSTVKILDSASCIELGTLVILLPEIEQEQPLKEGESIPIVEALKKEKEAGKVESVELNILFGIGEHEINEKYKDELNKIKEFISDKSQYVIILRGYACSIGEFEYNLKLSQERVENVKSFLIKEYGIDENLVETYYYGEKESIYDDSIEFERRKNRRVNIEVTGK